jgi:NAD+ synthetase
MVLDQEKLWQMLVERARELADGCKRVLLAVSGGIDSTLLAAILCKALGPENVVGIFRDIRSEPKHLQDVRELQARLGFKLIVIDANPMYDNFLAQTKEQFEILGLDWAEEGSAYAEEIGFANAYASLKSRFTTPMAGFIAKAIDNGNGRVFGTGNGEEDGLLRYFDKGGDGVVDNNILDGLTKAEVKQMAWYCKKISEQIILKIPSADLRANGDAHNDEGELTGWARKLGYDIKLSYGAPDGSEEGNIAWGWKQDIKYGVVAGHNSDLTVSDLRAKPFGYNDEQIQLIMFLRQAEKSTRHKVEPPPGLDRRVLIEAGVVDE